jgi:hypothetical protein
VAQRVVRGGVGGVLLVEVTDDGDSGHGPVSVSGTGGRNAYSRSRGRRGVASAWWTT